METLVCEQCGGELEIVADGIGRCIYNPKHIQKIPKKSTKLFQEAQKLWFEEKDFDKALEVYERILFENPKESSAHWGVLLCKYGIEYVKDYSGEYLPTCHRIVQESILEDGEYKLALDYAESRTEKLKYQEKAELIDRYQKKIQNIAANEEPVDVFISFKALDENGIPTADSALADRLYNYMTKELRLRVFFSTISLEGKTGEFEPYIYAALRSAKVLILIASSPEYVNAVWVKNEWSRFLRMIPEYQKKTVTIAMTGQMTKEALPKQLQVFTASTLNEPEKEAMFCHYVDEYIGELKCSLQKENKANDSEFEKLVLQQQVMKLEEAERFLVIGEFKWAENRFTEVCTRLKNNSSAYWGRLKATLHVKNDSELSQMTIEDLGKESDYILAVKYGDDEQKRKYQEIREECAKRYDFQQKVQHLQKEYDDNYEIFHKNMMAPRPKCQFISTQTRNELEQYYQLTAQIEKAEKKRQCKKEKSPFCYLIFLGVVLLMFTVLEFFLKTPSDVYLIVLLVCFGGLMAAIANGYTKRGLWMAIRMVISFLLFLIIWGLIGTFTEESGNTEHARFVYKLVLVAVGVVLYLFWYLSVNMIQDYKKSLEKTLEECDAAVRKSAREDLLRMNRNITEKSPYGKYIHVRESF